MASRGRGVSRRDQRRTSSYRHRPAQRGCRDGDRVQAGESLVGSMVFCTVCPSVDERLPAKRRLVRACVFPEAALAHHGVMVARDTDPMTSEHQYHVAQELKTGEKGDLGGGGRSAIDDALAQAIRGASGLATAYATAEQPGELMAPRKGVYVLPAIVTTARLLVLTTDLADADLSTGHLPATTGVEERPWIWFRVMTSSNARHKLTRLRQQTEQGRHSLADVADREYARSVGIVSVGGTGRIPSSGNQPCRGRLSVSGATLLRRSKTAIKLIRRGVVETEPGEQSVNNLLPNTG